MLMKRNLVRDLASEQTMEESSAEESDSDNSESGNSGDELVENETTPDYNNSSEPPSKMAKFSQSSLYRVPTNEEMADLKETKNLYHSSLFRMQIKEMLDEVKIKEHRQIKMIKVAEDLKTVLLSLPEGSVHKLSDQKWLTSQKVKIPIVQKPEVNGQFQFFPPTSVDVIGSFSLGASVKPNAHIDMAVEIPRKCIFKHDYLNHKYLRKRALYLATLAHYLRDFEMVQELKFTYHHGNHLKPILIVLVKGSSKKPVRIHLHSYCNKTVFQTSKFHIGKNNVWQTWFAGEERHDSGENMKEIVPTPVYNNTILEDMSMLENNQCLMKTLEDSSGIQDGICLLKVWLQQRQLNLGFGAFSGFIMSMFVVYLLSRKKLIKPMSSYQIMRNTLLNLSQANWTTEGISLCIEHANDKRPDLSDFHKTFDVTFVDLSGYVNLCATMTKSTFYQAKHEAKQALEILDDKATKGFEALFIKPLPFVEKFDQFFHICNTENLEHLSQKPEIAPRVLDLGGHFIYAVVPKLLEILGKALEKRVSFVQLKPESCPEWSINKSPPKLISPQYLTIGLSLIPEFASSVLEKGPPADSPEAKEFREFWGEKSEMRRFRDGSINEAVVWTTESLQSEKRLVCRDIVTYILNCYFDIPRESIHYVGNQLDSLLHIPITKKFSDTLYGTGEEQHFQVIQSYDSLCKILRKLDLPLSIYSIHGISPVFRFAEVFPALPANRKYSLQAVNDGNRLIPSADRSCPFWTPVLKVLCILESSGKWPDDIEAIRRLKAAFHIRLGELLSNELIFAVNVKQTFVDVFSNGYVFRVKIVYAREITVLKTMKTESGKVIMRDSEDSLNLEKEQKALPRLTSTLHGLQQQHTSYSSTVRLAKRWMAAQMMLDRHISEEAVELMVAHLFLSPEPFNTPGSPIVGFLRFLRLLSTFDWKTSPLLINLNNKFTKNDLAEIESKFIKDRANLPLMFLSTPLDWYSSHWTKLVPTVQIVHRLILLATESLSKLEQQLLEPSLHSDFRQIFRPPLSAYDVIIHLQLKHLARRHHSVDVASNLTLPLLEKVDIRHGKLFPVIEYEPVYLFLEELHAAYDEFAMFFYDKYGGPLIAVLWKPNAFVEQPFKVKHANGRMVTVGTDDSSHVKLIPNKEAFLQDFRVLGDGLIKEITIQTEGKSSYNF